MDKHNKVRGIFLLSVFLLVGCNQEPEQKPPVLSTEEKGIEYATVKPAYEDLLFEETVSCSYGQTIMYDLSFGLVGLPIESVDVKQGELVKKGQLLASLELEDMQEELSELEHKLEMKELELEQVTELKNKDLSIAKYVYQRTSNPYQYEDRQEEIKREYEKEIENLEHEIILYTEKVEIARDQVNKGTIYAPVDGEITYAKTVEEESYSKKDSTVVTVSDLTKCYFQSYAMDYEESYKDKFKPGERYQMQCSENGQYCYYNVTPVNMENWDSKETLFFALMDQSDLVEIGTIGTIVVNREEKNNVLCITKNAIHKSDTGQFVYVLKDGIREMRTIKVGLSANGKTEIISGLTDQDDVILEQSIEEETSSTEQEEGSEDGE